MGLMHPMYNHQGRARKKKRKKSQSLLVAEKQHNAWLKSMGLDKKPKRVNRTMLSVNYHTELPVEEKKEVTVLTCCRKTTQCVVEVYGFV